MGLQLGPTEGRRAFRGEDQATDGDTQGTVRRRRKVGAADSEESKRAGV